MRGNARILVYFSITALIVGTDAAIADETLSMVAQVNSASPSCPPPYKSAPLTSSGERGYYKLCSYDKTVPGSDNWAALTAQVNQTMADKQKQISDDQAKLRADLTAQIGNVLTPALLKQITDSVTQAATKQVMDNLRQQGVIK